MRPEIRTTNLLNQIFGELTVVQRAPNHPAKNCAMWVCRCTCGATTIVRADNLTSGNTKACALHGHRFVSISTKYPREYATWSAMKARCYNPNDQMYSSYGLRGITVCDAWRNSFEAFLRDMGPKPTDYSLERSNTYGNYEPGNCIWATREEQDQNKRKRACVMYKGEQRLLHDVTRELGLNYYLVRQRLVLGWSLEDALTKPKFARGTKVVIQYADGLTEREKHKEITVVLGVKSTYVDKNT